jgi:hypothetical protein
LGDAVVVFLFEQEKPNFGGNVLFGDRLTCSYRARSKALTTIAPHSGHRTQQHLPTAL